MKTLTSQVAVLTCRWGKPCSWTVKPKLVNTMPADVEPISQAQARQMRKDHQAATLRAVCLAAAA
jgi:hypothetical protein